MKRRTVIGIGVLATMLSICTVSADYDKEITFRDIPWGSDIETSIKIMGEDLDYSAPRNRDDYTYAYKSSNILELDYEHSESDKIGASVSVYTSDDFKVAGYDVNYIYLYFVTKFEGDKADFDNCTDSLYGGEYFFDCVDYETASKDLQEKLTGLYGEISETVKSDDKTIHIWNGANGTCCGLIEDLESSYNQLVLAYCSKTGDSDIDTADHLLSQLAKEEENAIFGNGDNSGL